MRASFVRSRASAIGQSGSISVAASLSYLSLLMRNRFRGHAFLPLHPRDRYPVRTLRKNFAEDGDNGLGVTGGAALQDAVAQPAHASEALDVGTREPDSRHLCPLDHLVFIEKLLVQLFAAANADKFDS